MLSTIFSTKSPTSTTTYRRNLFYQWWLRTRVFCVACQRTYTCVVFITNKHVNPRTNWPTYFQMHYLEREFLYLYSDLLEFCSLVLNSSERWIIISTEYHLAPTHHLNHWWPISVTHFSFPGLKWFGTKTLQINRRKPWNELILNCDVTCKYTLVAVSFDWNQNHCWCLCRLISFVSSTNTSNASAKVDITYISTVWRQPFVEFLGYV